MKVITISSIGEKNLSNTRYISKNLLCSIIDGFQGFQVPPAELESVLLTHPEIADAAVIGVDSVSEATELPRAYVVHAQPNSIKSEAQKAAFASSIQRWIQSKVARQKFLRGGTASTFSHLIGALIPSTCRCGRYHCHS